MGRWDDPRTECGRYVGLTEGRGRWGAWKLGIDGMFRKGVGRGMDGTEVLEKNVGRGTTAEKFLEVGGGWTG